MLKLCQWVLWRDDIAETLLLERDVAIENIKSICILGLLHNRPQPSEVLNMIVVCSLTLHCCSRLTIHVSEDDATYAAMLHFLQQAGVCTIAFIFLYLYFFVFFVLNLTWSAILFICVFSVNFDPKNQ